MTIFSPDDPEIAALMATCGHCGQPFAEGQTRYVPSPWNIKRKEVGVIHETCLMPLTQDQIEEGIRRCDANSDLPDAPWIKAGLMYRLATGDYS